jgi:hypothetical protein
LFALRAFFNRFSNMDMKIGLFAPFAFQYGVKLRDASRLKIAFAENGRVCRYPVRN